MIRWTGLAPWEFEFPFPCSLASTFLARPLTCAGFVETTSGKLLHKLLLEITTQIRNYCTNYWKLLHKLRHYYTSDVHVDQRVRRPVLQLRRPCRWGCVISWGVITYQCYQLLSASQLITTLITPAPRRCCLGGLLTYAGLEEITTGLNKLRVRRKLLQGYTNYFIGTVLNLRTTAAQKCAAVPRRARV